MYNTTINPINIVYRKPPKSDEAKNSHAQKEQEQSTLESNRRESVYTEISPRPQSAHIDFSKVNNTVNIAQIITDFRNTNIAINAPKEIQEEVDMYLALVEKESLKENPQRSIILSNLKNASRISDKYITDALKKPSNVVEGWIDALFAQNVVLKSDPTQINEVFQIKFQDKNTKTTTEKEEEPVKQEEVQKVKEQPSPFKKSSDYYLNATDELKQTFGKAKKFAKNSPADALKQYDEALKIASSDNNQAFLGAIHFEKARIFDQYDYIPNALDEYNKATLSPDDNLKSRAHLNMAKIYDEYVKYEPALNHYHQAIAYFGEANNPKGQTIAVKNLSGMFAQKYDKKNTEIFNRLSIERFNITEKPQKRTVRMKNQSKKSHKTILTLQN